VLAKAAGPGGGARIEMGRGKYLGRRITEGGAGATGIEPETVIQRDQQRHQTPPKPASAAFLITKISALSISERLSIYRSISPLSD
jgi:hypothetical protein